MNDPEVPAAASNRAPRMTLAELLHWSPLTLVLLYILGYIAANGHYARFELVKPTLVNARYLSAGLLFTAFVLPGTILGLLCVFHESPEGARRAEFPPTKAIALYALLATMYGLFLGATLLVNRSPWLAWAFGVVGFGLGLLAGTDFVRWERRPSNEILVSGVARNGVLLMALAYSFGVTVYPWVKPHYGGSAVLAGHIILKPEAPRELGKELEGMLLPLVDIDERFLYVIACRNGLRANPEVVMVPLDLLASARIGATPDTFLAVPAYLTKHSCPAGAGTEPSTP